MTSHRYAFTWGDLGRLVGGPVMGLLLYAVALHLGAWLNLLPTPQRPQDMDQTILLHQAEASRMRSGADVVLVEDSSCLMDVSAALLGAMLSSGHRALNLGTLSYLDLDSFEQLAGRYAEANSERVRTVVLLVHPEMLRRPATAASHVASLEAALRGTDYRAGEGWFGKLSSGLGLEVIRGRLLSRLVPVPLPADYGMYYGFTADLRRFMSQHNGSAVDPRRYVHRAGTDPVGYSLAAHWRASSESFRSRLPGSVRLAVGIAPIPSSHAAADYGAIHRDMLSEWSGWLRADVCLATLPATLPDALFASTTHLNANGARHFTRILARSLAHVVP